MLLLVQKDAKDHMSRQWNATDQAWRHQQAEEEAAEGIEDRNEDLEYADSRSMGRKRWEELENQEVVGRLAGNLAADLANDSLSD